MVTCAAPSWATLRTLMPTHATAASAAAHAASAPLWTLDGLRAADPVLGLALLMLVALLLAEMLHRTWRIPRICGHMLTGAIAGPVMLRLFEGLELDPWKPLIDLAIGAMLFELGTRIRPRWLLDNRWLAASCLLQSALCGVLVTGALVWLGAPWLSAAVVGTVALSTSPVIVLAVTHESRSRGQVTERLLLMTAVNAVIAVVGLKVLRIMLASDADSPAEEFTRASISALRVHQRLVPARRGLRLRTRPAAARWCAARRRCRCCRSRWSSSPACWPRSGRCRPCSRCWWPA